MVNTNIKIFFTSLLVFSTMGCIKKDIDSEQPTIDPIRSYTISKIDIVTNDPLQTQGVPTDIIDNGWTMKFDYDSQNRLISVTNFRTDRLRDYLFIYTNNTIDVKSTVVGEPSNKLDYIADLINSKIISISITNKPSYNTPLFDRFSYNSKNELQSNTYNDGMSSRVVDTYEWTDDNITTVEQGNTIKRYSYIAGEPNISNIDISPIVSSYFNRVELKPFLIIGALGKRSNNIMQDSSKAISRNVSYEYEYNNIGNLVKIIKTRIKADKKYKTTFKISYIY